jgi:hypothetical protein
VYTRTGFALTERGRVYTRAVFALRGVHSAGFAPEGSRREFTRGHFAPGDQHLHP